MATDRLTVTVVTPRGQVAARDVDQVTAPGVMGEFTVLPGHLPYLTGLMPGVLILTSGSQRDVYAVGKGYLQVGAGNTVRVLVNEARSLREIDDAQARRDLEDALEALKKGSAEGEEFALLEDRLAWARARVDAQARARG